MVGARSPQDHQGENRELSPLSDLVPMMEVVYRSVNLKLRITRSNEFRLSTMIQRDEQMHSELVKEKVMVTVRVGPGTT